MSVPPSFGKGRPEQPPGPEPQPESETKELTRELPEAVPPRRREPAAELRPGVSPDLTSTALLRRPKRRGPRPVFYVLAGLVAGVAATVAVMSLASTDDQPAPVASPAQSTGAATGAAPAAPNGIQELNAVAALGSTVVVAGAQRDSAGAYQAKFLTSADAGRTWQAGAITGADSARPRAIYPSGGGWLATGDRADGSRAVWTSKDGTRWSQAAAADTAAFTAADQIIGSAATPSVHAVLTTGGLLTSRDGGRWERRPADRLQLPGLAGRLTLTALGAENDKIVLHGTPAGRPDAAWESDDLRFWLKIDPTPPKPSAPATAAPLPAAPAGQQAVGSATTDAGTVIIGRSADGPALTLRDSSGTETPIDLTKIP